MHRALEQHQVGRQRVGALPGDLAGPGEVRPAALFQQLDVVQRREAELRRGAHGPQDHVGRVVRPDRGAFPRDGGGQQQQPVQLLVVSASCSRSALSWISSSACSARSSARLASSALANSFDELLRRAWAWSSSCWSLRLSPVEVEQLVDVQVNALDPDGGLHRVRVLPYLSPVQHGCASVLVTEFVACQPATKTLPAVAAATPRSFPPPGQRRAAGYGGYAATGEGGGECC